MNEHLKDPFFDYHQHLKVLPDHVLRDIARNDCADRDYRRQAVEILVVRKSVMANHPELADLKAELDVELDGLQFEYPAPEEFKPTSGPLVASVTTATMFSDGIGEEILRDPFVAADQVTEEEVQEAIKDNSPTAPDSVLTKPKKPRKPKEPVDAPSAE